MADAEATGREGGRIGTRRRVLAAGVLLAATAGLVEWKTHPGAPASDADLTPGASSSGQTRTAGPLTLTFVANMGVLVGSGHTKVLIDALFAEAKPNRRVPAPEVLEGIMRGEAPFDGIDLVLVTHKDPDHFDAALTARHLEAHPEPILVVPADAVHAMREAASDWSRIESRIVPIDLEIGEQLERDVGGIPVTIMRTYHGTSRAPMNLMYLFEINGWLVFHEGDASGRPDDYRGFGLESVPVDLGVVQYSWPIGHFRRFFPEVFRLDHIALGHVSVRHEQEAPRTVDQVRQIYNDIFVLLPDMPPRVFQR